MNRFIEGMKTVLTIIIGTVLLMGGTIALIFLSAFIHSLGPLALVVSLLTLIVGGGLANTLFGGR